MVAGSSADAEALGRQAAQHDWSLMVRCNIGELAAGIGEEPYAVAGAMGVPFRLLLFGKCPRLLEQLRLAVIRGV
jgi:hypothetical protein